MIFNKLKIINHIMMIAGMILLISILSPINAYAETSNTSNTCATIGCNNAPEGESPYCIRHKCKHSDCNNGRVKLNGAAYCRTHTCRVTSCTNEVSTANNKCTSCKNKKRDKNRKWMTITHRKNKTSLSSGNKTGTTKSSTKSYQSYSPDCDDYDSYDDFMDDWDGYIPGGGDAEDYWEDW